MLSKHEEQDERRRVLDNDRKVREQGSTFLAHTHNDVGGRFAAISSPVVVGENQIPNYPAAYHQVDPVPDEPCLGIDVNAMDTTGEKFEVERSVPTSSALPLAEHGDPTAIRPPGAVGSPTFSSRTYRRR